MASALQKLDVSTSGLPLGTLTRAILGKSRVVTSSGVWKSSNSIIREEIMVIMDRFDRDGDGFIQYSEFCSFVNGDDASEPVVRAVRGSADSYNKNLGPELVGVLKAQVSDIASSSTTLRAAFKPLYEIDRKRTGSLDPADFERALYESGFNLRPRFMRALVQCFDFTRSARVEYAEFVDFVGTLVEVGSSNAEIIGDDLRRIVQKAKRRVWTIRLHSSTLIRIIREKSTCRNFGKDSNLSVSRWERHKRAV